MRSVFSRLPVDVVDSLVDNTDLYCDYEGLQKLHTILHHTNPDNSVIPRLKLYKKGCEQSEKGIINKTDLNRDTLSKRWWKYHVSMWIERLRVISPSFNKDLKCLNVKISSSVTSRFNDKVPKVVFTLLLTELDFPYESMKCTFVRIYENSVYKAIHHLGPEVVYSSLQTEGFPIFRNINAYKQVINEEEGGLVWTEIDGSQLSLDSDLSCLDLHGDILDDQKEMLKVLVHPPSRKAIDLRNRMCVKQVAGNEVSIHGEDDDF